MSGYAERLRRITDVAEAQRAGCLCEPDDAALLRDLASLIDEAAILAVDDTLYATDFSYAAGKVLLRFKEGFEVGP